MQGNRDGSWPLRASANGGSGGYHPQATHVYSNFNIQQPIRYNLPTQQNLNFAHPQIPSFRPHQFAQSGDNVWSQIHGSAETSSRGNVELIRIDNAVKEMRRSLVAGGENVSSIKVSQSVLSQLPPDSQRSLGMQMQDVPSLRQLMTLEGKIYAFIHCFIGARGIVTLHDLEVAICRNECVDCFDDLKLGPLLRHPLVLLYFPSISGCTGTVPITSEEIISFLDSYLNTYGMEDVNLYEFLDFVAEKKSVTRKEELGVRIQSLRMYVSFIQDAKQQEGESLEILLTGLHQKYQILSSKKQRQDESLTVSEHNDVAALHHKGSCGSGKHTRFDSSSSDDDDSSDYEVKYFDSSEHVSRCPYPSVAEEMKKLERSKKKRKAVTKKRKAETRSHEKSDLSKQDRRSPSKLLRGHVKQEIPKVADDSDTKQVFSVNEADITLSEGALRLFISTWKDTCKELSMSMFVEKILSFYNLGGSEVQPQKKRAKAMSSFPFVGLLHVARGLVTEALEEQKTTEITNRNVVAGYDNSAGTSSRATKPIPFQTMPIPFQTMRSSSTSGNLVQEWNNSLSTDFSTRDQFHTGTDWATQIQQTGKKGEEIAYRYYAAKYGKEAVVSWVNEQSETGLPYDLVIEHRGGKKEYIEVKATVCAGKDSFNLTVQEWQFANEKGESYVIAHVLLGNNNAILTQHRNLVKLCQQGHLRLVIIMPNQRNGANIEF